MIAGLLWLLGCQLVGEVLSRLLHLPIPGPVIGLVLMLGLLVVRERLGRANDGVYTAADGLLAHLQLFFAPAGVGVFAYAALLAHEWLPIVVAMLGSWLLGLLAVGWIVQFWPGGRAEGQYDDRAVVPDA